MTPVGSVEYPIFNSYLRMLKESPQLLSNVVSLSTQKYALDTPIEMVVGLLPLSVDGMRPTYVLGPLPLL